MTQNPFGILLYLFLTLWLGNMWLRDLRDAKKNPESAASGLPGATPCPTRAIVIAVAGTFLLLAAETFGEIKLGISAEQTDVSVLFLIAMITAAIAEEFIFRGFLVVESRGNAAKWLSIFAFSAIFALVHPYLWSFEMPDDATKSFVERVFDAFSVHFTVKAFFTTGFIFAGSLWFYYVRFFRWNPQASLLAPIAAHLAKNVAVFFIKLAQGHVTSFF